MIEKLAFITIFCSSLLFSEKPFVKVRLDGQMGNQMFEIAACCALAWENGAEPVITDLQLQNTTYKRFFTRFLPMAPKKKTHIHLG